MKKLSLLLGFSLLFSSAVFAAEATGTAPEAEATVAEPVSPASPEPDDATGTSVASVTTESSAADETQNLEFVSGEVSSLDESAKTLTVKLYGESEQGSADKQLTVKVDETTDITDGEKDRELKSLTAGTEIDVEYDPAANKATYIFVY